MESLFKDPSSESELVSDSDKKSKNRSVREIETYKCAFLLFNWLIGVISFTIIIYIGISNRSPSKVMPPLPASCPPSPSQSRNLYGESFSFDFHALLRENETNFDQESELIWTMQKLTYGDLQSVHRFSTNVTISEVSADRQFGMPLKINFLFLSFR